MRSLIILTGLTLNLSLTAQASIPGSTWFAVPVQSISIHEQTLCSPNPGDHPQFPPEPFGNSYLKFVRGSNGWFFIEEHNQCSSWFGGSGTFQFQAVGPDVLDVSGKKVGTISPTTLNISEGTSNGIAYTATILSLKFQVNPNGSASFASDFKSSAKTGAIFHQTANYFPAH